MLKDVINMHGYIHRKAEEDIRTALSRSPVVAILGPRQCGKSTLAKEFMKKVGNTVYLDLQDRMDRNKLNEPELYLDQHRDKLVCLDEIQRMPDFFSVLRSEVDRERRAGRFLILGSASRDLINQSNETLAGRIEYLDLTPFMYEEIGASPDIAKYWNRGGFPESFLARSDDDSFQWRRGCIRTFLERDIPVLGYSIPIPIMERLWSLLAHYHGQTVNYSKLAESVDISVPSIKKYLAILEQTYMVRVVHPFERNIQKRLVKAPKIYIRDSGILHALLGVERFDDLLSHSSVGASWEGLGIENIVTGMPHWTPSFMRTSNGAEVDLILEKGKNLRLYEFKASKAPKPSRGFFEIVDSLKPEKAFIVSPVDAAYEYRKDIWVMGLDAGRR